MTGLSTAFVAFGGKLIDAAIEIIADETIGRRLRAFFAERRKKQAFTRAIRVAFGRFRERHPDLAASFFDEAFLTTCAAPALARLLTMSGSVDPQRIAEAYQSQFRQPIADVTKAAEDFISFLREALDAEEELAELWHRRQTAETHEIVTALVPPIYEGIADLKAALCRDTTATPFTPNVLSIDNEAILRAFGTASRALLGWPQETAGRWIERPELDQLHAEIGTGESSFTVLLGGPGGGKSALLSRLGGRLRREGIALLALKADLVPKSVGTLAALDAWLGTPAPAVDCLRELARERPTVLLIDQLDALGDLMDQNTARLSTLLSLVNALAGVENVHIILSCREFEFRHDLRLAALGATPIHLADPPWDKVERLLTDAGLDIRTWPKPVRELLRTPQHLSLFLNHLAEDGGIPVFGSYQSMLEAVFRKRVIAPYGASVLEAAYAIAGAMAEEEELWLPTARFDRRYAAELAQLVAAGILEYGTDRRQITFRHQTLFDFARARAFAARETSLADHVLERHDAVFVRPTLWSALHYLRGSDRAAYRREVARLWAHQPLRLHLRLLLISFLGQVPDPDVVEAGWLLPLLDDAALRRRALWSMRGNPSWFVKLRPRLPALMTGDLQIAFQVSGVLRSALAFDRDFVLGLIERHWLPEPAFDAVAFETMRDLDVWDERSLAIATTVVCRASIHAAYVRQLVGTVSKSAPDLAPRLVSAKLWADLERARAEQGAPFPAPIPEDASPEQQVEQRLALDAALYGPLRRLLKNQTGWHDLDKVAKAAPRAFVDAVWPWFLEIADSLAVDANDRYHQYRGDRTLAFDFGDDDRHRYPLPTALLAGIVGFARSAPADFLAFVRQHEARDLMVVHYLLARGLAEIAASCPDGTLEYLLGDPRRLAVGDFRDTHEGSRRLIAAVAPHLDAAAFGRLEKAVLGWHFYRQFATDDVKLRWEQRKWDRGHRLRVVRALPKDRLSAEGRRVLEEEERALPGPPDRDIGRIKGGWIRSPVSAEQMRKASDDHILGLFEELHDGTEWNHPRRPLSGGSIEAAREFAEFAKAEPNRALRLLNGFRPGAQERPAAYALEALADIQSIAAEDLVGRIHDLDQRGFRSAEFRSGAANALAKLARRLNGLDSMTCTLLEGWLPEVLAKESGEDSPEGDQEEQRSLLWDHGFRILPGGNYPILHALTMGYLLREPMAADAWLMVLERCLDRQEEGKVWEALAEDLRYLQNADRERATAFFARLFDRHPDLLATEAGVRLVAWNHRWLPAAMVHAVLDGWVAGNWSGGPQAAGEIAMLRFVTVPDDTAGAAFVEHALAGTHFEAARIPLMRLGVTYTAVQLWGESAFRNRAGSVLLRLIPEADEEIAKVIFDVFRLNDPLPVDRQTDLLLDALMAHPETLRAGDPIFLIDRLKELLRDGYGAERIARLVGILLDHHGTEVADIRTHWAASAGDLIDIALTLQRLPETRAEGLDLFERLIDLNVHDIEDVLMDIDRRIGR